MSFFGRLTKGVVDTPPEAGSDHLNIAPFVAGLSNFIVECQTPMTIAVQGDWGTGKTNTMLLTERAIADDSHYRLSDAPADPKTEVGPAPVYTIRFNTWQYSQFDLGERLVGSLLENIGAHLMLANPGGRSAAKRQAFMQTLLPIASNAGMGILKAALNVSGLSAISGAIEEVKDSYNSVRAASATRRNEDAAAVLVNVRDAFEAAVSELVSTASETVDDSGRLVVFIDDLDRLEPRKAVELMEALKLFLDVPHCVFILAIDFSVVHQGVIEKYGERMGRGKSRAFFDKIIQVPFQMPVGAFDTERFFTQLISDTGFPLAPDEQPQVLRLIGASVGSNPRAIKRLINTALLQRSITDIQHSSRTMDDGTGDAVATSSTELFAILCFQTAYPDTYAEILKRGVLSSQLVKNFFADAEEVVSETDEDSSASFEAGSGESDTGTGGDARTENEALRLELANAQIEDMDHFQSLVSEVRRVFSPGETFDDLRFADVFRQAVATSSGTERMQDDAEPRKRGQKAYGRENRRQRILEELRWSRAEEKMRLAEEFAGVLERLDGVEIGAEAANPSRWVIEVHGKRVGQVLLHQRFFHVVLEPRWFSGEEDTLAFLRKFRAAFPDWDPDRFDRNDETGWFGVLRLGQEDTAFVADLAGFWSELLSDEVSFRNRTGVREA
ncbi:KAP family P-loop NTPase fold protein [Leucobacter iarius]|uniref:KAP NTPase domain-containing protein n=1 Tax=Leucobacter iarius TaxID=333963 RepID=A0ABN2LKZ4_9MICO